MNPLSNTFKFVGLAAVVLGAGAFSPSLIAKEYVSQINATEVIELFTSEGCSSCPPADRWLTTLKDRPETFTSLIPMAFHVDYWDYIGWKDRFAKPAYGLRQRQYVSTGNVSQAYTPQMVTNSDEWRGFLSGQLEWKANNDKPGVLKATLQDPAENMVIHFSPQGVLKPKHYVLNVAVLGMGLSSRVTAGENHDRTLQHDFVVLSHDKKTVAVSPSRWEVKKPLVPNMGQTQSAIAVWLSVPDSQKIIQATGGYL